MLIVQISFWTIISFSGIFLLHLLGYIFFPCKFDWRWLVSKVWDYNRLIHHVCSDWNKKFKYLLKIKITLLSFMLCHLLIMLWFIHDFLQGEGWRPREKEDMLVMVKDDFEKSGPSLSSWTIWAATENNLLWICLSSFSCWMKDRLYY